MSNKDFFKIGEADKWFTRNWESLEKKRDNKSADLLIDWLEPYKKDINCLVEIGCGSGYQAAILALLCRRVYTMERLKPLLVDAENRLRDLRISNIVFRLGDGSKGWPEAAPFDRIILTCGCNKIPDILLQQLKIGGIMVAPEGHGKEQKLVVVSRHERGFERLSLMPVTFVPLVEEG